MSFRDIVLFGVGYNVHYLCVTKQKIMNTVLTTAEKNKVVNQLSAPEKWLYNEIKTKGAWPIPNGRNLLSTAGDLKIKGLVIFRWDLNKILPA